MLKVLLRSLLIVATCGVIHDRINADSSMVANDYFGTSGSWSSGGGNTLFFNYDPDYYGYYVEWNGTLWATITDNGGGYGYHYPQTTPSGISTILYMSEDGNLMLIAEPSGVGAVIWQTHTGGNWGSYLRVQDDGNLVIRTPSDAPLWSVF